MTPEVIQTFIESGHMVRVVWDHNGGDCYGVVLPDHIDGPDLVTGAGNRIPVAAITSIARAGDAADDGGVR